ncbi:hypothetical protein [Cryobacterium sp. MDB2-33-2]|uniref:lipopolysaccharide biosynthesis protein n=1 Tax=Cryobacterium sp. MDB2-33-2 TaxID=1259179 RepID=UPI00106D484F|nr:hypothetical protein [Cryobacterium sp. MDB2-33-2]TFC08844.1 hypothetical protein E3O59_06910 [Cryobacterium sp. MDB2-33-2]
MKVFRRIVSYSASVVLMTVINVAVIPTVIILAGTTAWAGIAVAQSVASFTGVIVAFGWGVTGPSEVAGLPQERRGQFFADSMASRLWLFILGTPAMAIVVSTTAPGNSIANILAAFALLLPALGASWFFVGEKSPWRLFFLENIPRATGTLIGTVVLFASGDIALFAAAQVVGAVICVLISWLNVSKRYPGFAWHGGIRSSLQRLRAQTAGVVTAGTSALYVNLPLVIVALFFPSATAPYAMADKLMKFVLSGYSPAVQIAQGYVPQSDSHRHRNRASLAAIVAGGMGLVMGLGYAIFAPQAVGLLSSDQVQITWAISIPLGLALAAIATSAIVGLACLTSLGALRQVATSTVLGAVVGIPLLLAAGVFSDPSGIAWATALSEIAVAVYQVIHFRRILPNIEFTLGKTESVR